MSYPILNKISDKIFEYSIMYRENSYFIYILVKTNDLVDK